MTQEAPIKTLMFGKFCLLTSVLSLSLISSQAFGKYRAYKLKIINDNAGTEREVMSTLDHIQYKGYYHLNPGERIIYVDSWMCWGNTGGYKPICSKEQSKRPPHESIFPEYAEPLDPSES